MKIFLIFFVIFGVEANTCPSENSLLHFTSPCSMRQESRKLFLTNVRTLSTTVKKYMTERGIGKRKCSISLVKSIRENFMELKSYSKFEKIQIFIDFLNATIYFLKIFDSNEELKNYYIEHLEDHPVLRKKICKKIKFIIFHLRNEICDLEIENKIHFQKYMVYNKSFFPAKYEEILSMKCFIKDLLHFLNTFKENY